MMYENAKVPKIEKLDQQEFDLDIEEQEKQLVNSEKEVARVCMCAGGVNCCRTGVKSGQGVNNQNRGKIKY